MRHSDYTSGVAMHHIQRQIRHNQIVEGMRRCDKDIMAAFWARHDASQAMFAELHRLIDAGEIVDVETYLAEAQKDLPQDVCLKCESFIDVPREEHTCAEEKAENSASQQEDVDLEF